MNNFNELVEKVKEWGYDKNIIDKVKPKDQFGKFEEEKEELKSALDSYLAKVRDGDRIYSEDINEIIDGIGDVTVTLILLSEILDLNYQRCLEYAYNQIKDREGTIKDDSNGNKTFVKEVNNDT